MASIVHAIPSALLLSESLRIEGKYTALVSIYSRYNSFYSWMEETRDNGDIDRLNGLLPARSLEMWSLRGQCQVTQGVRNESRGMEGSPCTKFNRGRSRFKGA